MKNRDLAQAIFLHYHGSKETFARTINATVFVPFKNGLNTDLWVCLHITSKNIKGATRKNGEVDGASKISFSLKQDEN